MNVLFTRAAEIRGGVKVTDDEGEVSNIWRRALFLFVLFFMWVKKRTGNCIVFCYTYVRAKSSFRARFPLPLVFQSYRQGRSLTYE